METDARIGPNAVLQMLPHIEAICGHAGLTRMLADAGIQDVPDGTRMIAEGEAARLHQIMRREQPRLAQGVLSAAGHGTAEYILAHRIPKPVQVGLTWSPAPVAAWVLSKAIAKHAWTFAGSGRFSVPSPWHFQLHDNPIVRGEHSETPLCHWHAAVFATLYQRLVHPKVRCVETTCCAQPGQDACRFQLHIHGSSEPSRCSRT